MYTLQFDGLFYRFHLDTSSYSGIMCYGWLVTRDGSHIAQGHGGYAHWKLATSNGAEYLALIAGLEALIDLQANDDPVLICGDAKTIIHQMQNQALIHSQRIDEFHRQARKLSRNFKNIQWMWTPRRDNRSADQLTRQALNTIRFESPFYFSPDFYSMEPTNSRRGLQSIMAFSTISTTRLQ
ncbi:MAG: ribonuclease HI family protein [Leptolinea sp.]|nr:ribonuclease HI family protein [Leptolinea sp.]